MTRPSRDTATIIRSAMEALGVPYDLHIGPAEAPLARFSIAGRDSAPLAASATIVRGTIRLTLHDLMPGPPELNDLWLFDDVNQNWAFGRVFYNEDGAAYECSAGLLIDTGGVTPGAIRFTAAHLADAAPALKGYSTPFFTAPHAGREVTLADLARATEALGVPFQSVSGGAMLEQQLTERNRSFRVQLFVAGDCLFIRGRLVPVRPVAQDEAAIRKIHFVNARLGAGTVSVWRDNPQPYYQLVVPMAWAEVSPSLLRRLIDETAAVVELIDAQF